MYLRETIFLTLCAKQGKGSIRSLRAWEGRVSIQMYGRRQENTEHTHGCRKSEVPEENKATQWKSQVGMEITAIQSQRDRYFNQRYHRFCLACKLPQYKIQDPPQPVTSHHHSGLSLLIPFGGSTTKALQDIIRPTIQHRCISSRQFVQNALLETFTK